MQPSYQISVVLTGGLGKAEKQARWLETHYPGAQSPLCQLKVSGKAKSAVEEDADPVPDEDLESVMLPQSRDNFTVCFV